MESTLLIWTLGVAIAICSAFVLALLRAGSQRSVHTVPHGTLVQVRNDITAAKLNEAMWLLGIEPGPPSPLPQDDGLDPLDGRSVYHHVYHQHGAPFGHTSEAISIWFGFGVFTTQN